MSNARLARWQKITLATLFTGYTGYYICRSNLAVANPLILEEFGSQGIDKSDMGHVVSVGVLLYSIGKVTNGLLADYVGGRLMFIFGMLASVLCTILFGMAGVALFTIIWATNRYFQSMGWNALVKTASRWYPVYRHATVMGILSMSYLIGDAFARFYLGLFIEIGVGWRGIFFIAAGTFSMITVVALLTLKSSPEDIGEEEPAASPENVFGDEGNSAKPESIWKLLSPLLSSWSFWFVCACNFGLTLIRETFNFWTPTYLYETTDLGAGKAAVGSLLFPLVGALSALVCGILSDRIGRNHGRIIVPALVLLVGALALLGLLPVYGNWTTSDGRLSVSGLKQEDQYGITLLNTDDRPPENFGIAVRVEPGAAEKNLRNSFVIFDYRSPTNFKFAGLRATDGVYGVGHYEDGWIDDVNQEATIDPASPHVLQVEIDGGSVHLSADGDMVASHDFAQPLNTGAIGLGAVNAGCAFDDFVLRSAGNGSVPPGVPTTLRSIDFSEPTADDFKPLKNRAWVALLSVCAVSFFLIGPYSFLSGVLALDLGGKRGSSTTAGLVDSAGYLGGILSGSGIGILAESYGWGTAFGALAGVGALTIVAAVAYWQHHEYTLRKIAQREREAQPDDA